MEVSLKNKKEKSQIVFVLGGPGSGKGTQCERLVRDFHYKHLSVGDLMRAEIQNKTKEGNEVQAYVARGALVPDSLTVQILMKAIKASNNKKFLIDGFPRSLPQAIELERLFREIDFILNFECPEDVLIQRLLERGKSSGRVDDQSIETVKERIKTFNTQTFPAIQYYTRLGKVRNVSSDSDIETVYKRTREALLPNVITLYWPPSTGQSYISQTLASHLNYTLINLHSFFESKGCLKDTDEIKTGHLISYIRDHSSRNFIIDNFPQTLKQLKIFTEHFVEPMKLIYLNASKDNVEDIYKNQVKDKKDRKQLLDEYDHFCNYRKEILPFILKKKYYHVINANSSLSEQANLLISQLSPQVLVYPQPNHNPNVKIYEYCENLVKQRGFIHLNLKELIQSESQRNTELWQKIISISNEEIQLGNEKIFILLRKIIYSDPYNKKFIISDAPIDDTFCQAFIKQVCNIDYYITEGGDMIPLNKNPFCDYHMKGKLIPHTEDQLGSVDNFIQDRCKFGWILGPSLSGKTTVAQHLLGKYATEIFKFDEATEVLKKRLATEDNPDVEVQPAEMIKYIKERVSMLKKGDVFIVDGWPANYTLDMMNQCLSLTGFPDFIISLNMSKEIGIKRLKTKNEADSDEGLDEPVQKSLEENNKIVKVFRDALANKQATLTIYTVDVNVSAQDTLKDIDKIIYRKVILVRDLVRKSKELNLDNFIAKFCINNKLIFVNVPELLKEALKANDQLAEQLKTQLAMSDCKTRGLIPSLFNPSLVARVIKKFLQTSGYESRYIIIYDYPSSDKQIAFGNEPMLDDLYPRSLDELYHLENGIGPIRGVVQCMNSDLNYKPQINDPIMPKVVEVKKEIIPKDGDDGAGGDGAAGGDQGQDNQDGKPKFDPSKFDWSVSNGCPKTFTQIFHKKFAADKISKVTCKVNNGAFKSLEDSFGNILRELEGGSQFYYSLEALFA